MIALDEDAVICDLAETYHVFNYRALPLSTVATLVSGLRENSRIRSKLAGYRAGFDTVMTVRALDILENLRWMLSDKGRHGEDPPKMMLPFYLEQKGNDTGRFASADEFEQVRARFFR